MAGESTNVGPGVVTAAEEDASELLFPAEFEDAETKTLLISEVHILLEHRKTQNESQVIKSLTN